ncbi:hypothetical protein BGX38DRAFT_1289941 [Terfezia claveryi]|nr:hypothetical protein BGX38DRAFT_1289941 [Terfezia claveryi]
MATWDHGFPPAKEVTFFYRDVEQCIRYLLHQKVYAQYLVFKSQKDFDRQGNRVYTEMHTGDWWWDTQMTLPVASSLVPILITSDQTCLTNFSGTRSCGQFS